MVLPCQMGVRRINRASNYLSVDSFEFLNSITEGYYLSWTYKCTKSKTTIQSTENYFSILTNQVGRRKILNIFHEIGLDSSLLVPH